MQASPATLPVALQLHERLHRWRRRQALRWPGLFGPSLSLPQVDARDHAGTRAGGARAGDGSTRATPEATTISLHLLRDNTAQVHLNGTPVFICDGCASLQPLPMPTASSDSTLSPARAAAVTAAAAATTHATCVSTMAVDSVRCPICTFVTPFAPLRRLLRLPVCGPRLPLSVALTLLLEAVGAPAAIASTPAALRPWLLDSSCRRDGLDALLQALGLTDELLVTAAPSHAGLPLVAPPPLHMYALQAERFLSRHAASSDMVQIPLSVTHLASHACDPNGAPVTAPGLVPSPPPSRHMESDLATPRYAAEKAAHRSSVLVAEASRIWKQYLDVNDPTRLCANLYRFTALSREFLCEQSAVRSYMHTTCSQTSATLEVSQQAPISDGPSRPQSIHRAH